MVVKTGSIFQDIIVKTTCFLPVHNAGKRGPFPQKNWVSQP